MNIIMEKVKNNEKEIVDLITEIEESYIKEIDLNLINCPAVPKMKNIESIIDDFFRIVFPGFINDESNTILSTHYYIASLVKQLYEKLLDQLYCAFQYHYQFTNNEGKDYEKQIKKISLEIFAAIPEIRRLMSLDVRAALKGDPAALSYHEIILSYPFIKTITVHRLAHILYNAQVPIIPRMMNEWAHTKTGIDIHPGAKIGESFFIDHGTGVVIGETTEIGNNVKLYQGVTLGALSFKKDGQGNIIKGRKRHPTLKDNVVVYANATILGGQTVIGSNCIIGGNTWIIKSIEDNTIVTIDKPTLVYRKINDK